MVLDNLHVGFRISIHGFNQHAVTLLMNRNARAYAWMLP